MGELDMFKKIILIILSFLLIGCSSNNINKMSLNEIIDSSIETERSYINVNNKGYRYYLPDEFVVYEDNDYVQTLLSKNHFYFLNIDIVSYYYKNNIIQDRNLDDYDYYDFNYNDKTGYMRLTKKGDNFLVELCYNYAIIEVEVEESELRYAVSRGISILKSIQYNDLIIGNYIEDNNIENSETVYNIPEPENKDDNKNVLEYIEEFQYDNSDDLD
jgi:hypothetical protein